MRVRKNKKKEKLKSIYKSYYYNNIPREKPPENENRTRLCDIGTKADIDKRTLDGILQRMTAAVDMAM